MSYTSNEGTIAEMGSPRFASTPQLGRYSPHHSYNTHSPSPPPVEMGSNDHQGRDLGRESDQVGPNTISRVGW